jgi:formylglycine-generating enzyme required for sulfatase activity
MPLLQDNLDRLSRWTLILVLGFVSATGLSEAAFAAGYSSTTALPNDKAISINTAPGTQFSDCPQCPALMVIPSGHFTMTRKRARDGRKDDDPEGVAKTKPARDVTIEKAFAIGIYPVTRKEFSAFVRETHRAPEKGCHVQMGGVWVLDETKDWRNPGFAQTAGDPVTCVSWTDAQAYIQWLNGKVDDSVHDAADSGPYRAPSWEEIEYATGAGRTTPYYWGERPEHDKANYGADQCWPCRPKKQGADRWLYTSPVGAFPPNAFGLYDMAGNVWQWARRCRPDPKDSLTGACRSQVLHGGSWLTNPEYLLTGEYSFADARHRNNEIGFRVAKTLVP